MPLRNPALGCGGSTDAACTTHVVSLWRNPLTTNHTIHVKDFILTISGNVGGLRTLIEREYTRRGLASPTWTNSSLTNIPIKDVHINETETKLSQLLSCRCDCNVYAGGGCGCNSNNYRT